MSRIQPDYFKDRHLPVYNVDPKDRKVLERIKWYTIFLSINSFFWWFFAIAGIWLTVAGAVYIKYSPNYEPFRAELGVGIFFLIMFAICFILGFLLHYRLTKDAEVIKKYDDNFDNYIMVKFFWLAKEKPMKCTWSMIAFGLLMDLAVLGDVLAILKRKHLTDEQEHQWELEWVKSYAAQHHVTLHQVEDENLDPWSDDPDPDPK